MDARELMEMALEEAGRAGAKGSEPMDDRELMEMALEQAELAQELGEIPIGAVLAHEGRIIARGHNRRQIDQDPAGHAELLVIRQAAEVLGSWRLIGTTMAVTAEPCPMCAGALVLARVARLVYGCRDPKAGAVRSLYQICDDPRLNHRLEIEEGVEEERCAALLSAFFGKIRKG